MPRTYPPKMKMRPIDMPDEMWDQVTVAAGSLGCSRAAFVRYAITDAIKVVAASGDETAPVIRLDAEPITTLPTVADLVGSDPDFTGAKSAEAYVRELRDDDAREIPIAPAPQGIRGNNGCPHPKANRRQLAYGTFCDACQDMVR